MAHTDYDSRADTEPEKSFYDQWRPVLSAMQYNSPEYLAAIKQLQPAIQHHYEANSHHPEHYHNGIDGMTLLDLIEMLVDWKAAIERKNSDEYVLANWERTKQRFQIEPQLAAIIENTVTELGWGVDR